MYYPTYQDYLNSREWRRKAHKRALIDDFTCQMCGAHGTRSNPLHIHHLTYRNIYNENVFTDLVTLCNDCHIGVHKMMSRITDSNGRRGWKDSLPEFCSEEAHVLDI